MVCLWVGALFFYSNVFVTMSCDHVKMFPSFILKGCFAFFCLYKVCSHVTMWKRFLVCCRGLGALFWLYKVCSHVTMRNSFQEGDHGKMFPWRWAWERLSNVELVPKWQPISFLGHRPALHYGKGLRLATVTGDHLCIGIRRKISGLPVVSTTWTLWI